MLCISNSGYNNNSRNFLNRKTTTNNENSGYTLNYIKKRTTPGTVIFLTGVSKSYPILRSHTVLNALHQQLDEVSKIGSQKADTSSTLGLGGASTPCENQGNKLWFYA